ncbi:hypothetical protein DFP73DRAFT_530878 [Morchella snyderi]|nr:hypothetical protein DFP73DRAFT_530878 [Morchella snyderi]
MHCFACASVWPNGVTASDGQGSAGSLVDRKVEFLGANNAYPTLGLQKILLGAGLPDSRYVAEDVIWCGRGGPDQQHTKCSRSLSLPILTIVVVDIILICGGLVHRLSVIHNVAEAKDIILCSTPLRRVSEPCLCAVPLSRASAPCLCTAPLCRASAEYTKFSRRPIFRRDRGPRRQSLCSRR